MYIIMFIWIFFVSINIIILNKCCLLFVLYLVRFLFSTFINFIVQFEFFYKLLVLYMDFLIKYWLLFRKYFKLRCVCWTNCIIIVICFVFFSFWRLYERWKTLFKKFWWLIFLLLHSHCVFLKKFIITLNELIKLFFCDFFSLLRRLLFTSHHFFTHLMYFMIIKQVFKYLLMRIFS